MASEDHLKEYFHEDDWNALSSADRIRMTQFSFEIDGPIKTEINESEDNDTKDIYFENNVQKNYNCEDNDDGLIRDKDTECDNSQNEDNDVLYCEKCKLEYENFCSNCSMLVHILDESVPFGISDRARKTVPKNILEVKSSSRNGEGVFTSKTIPEHVIFGPFDGLDKLKNESGYSFEYMGTTLIDSEKEENANWMLYVNYTKDISKHNLIPFQCKSDLFYKSTRQINKNEELLVLSDELFENVGRKYIQPKTKRKIQNVYACIFCCLGFGIEKHLLQHRARCPYNNRTETRNHNKSIVRCSRCDVFLCHDELDGHKSFCEERHRRKLELVKRAAVKFRCTQCDYRTNNMTTFKKHYKDVHKDDGDIRLFKCDVCDKAFTDKHGLKKHKFTHGEKTISCYICKKTFRKKANIVRHMMQHTGERPFSCKCCDYKTIYKENLKLHVRNKHGNGEKIYNCSKCEYKTNSSSQIARHNRVHSGVRNFECHVCGKKFMENSDLKRHYATHTGEKNFLCNQCDKTCTSNGNLKTHIFHSHTEKPFQCDHCNFKCVTRAQLDKHSLQKHPTGGVDKKFKCDQCKYQTNDKGNFNKHANIHTGFKPYKCDICGRGFSWKKAMEDHKGVHISKKPFQCAICEKKFARKISLKRHILSHMGQKRYRCDYCDYQCNSKYGLHLHMETKHEASKYHNEINTTSIIRTTNNQGISFYQ